MKIIPYLKFDQSLLASAAASFTQIVFIHAEYYKVYFKEKLSPIWLQIIKLYKICCCRDTFQSEYILAIEFTSTTV